MIAPLSSEYQQAQPDPSTADTNVSRQPSLFDRQGKQPIALFLLEVSHLDARLLELSLTRPTAKTIHLVADMASAEVVLVDCDLPQATGAVQLALSTPGLAVVGYAANPKESHRQFPDLLVLGKPLKIEELTQALTLVSALKAKEKSQATGTTKQPVPVHKPAPISKPQTPRAQQPNTMSEPTSAFGDSVWGDDNDLCGKFPDIPRVRPAKLPEKLFFNPDNYLVGTLHKAVQESRSTGEALAILGFPRLIRVHSSPERICLSSFTGTRLRPASMTQLPSGTARIVADPGPQQEISREVRYTHEDLLWNVAVWGARGRLPKGCDPYRPVRLRVWPDFANCFSPPHALRIAALWVERAATPVDMAAELQIPQRYVFTFFTAAYFAGLLDRRNDPLPIDPRSNRRVRQEQSSNSSMLERMLRKLLDAL
jgi:hypothetical protein